MFLTLLSHTIACQIIFRAMIFLCWQFRKQFGNVFSLQNCWTNVVVLNGYKTVKEALVNKSEDFADRPYFPGYEHLGYGHKSEGRSFANIHFPQALAQGGLARRCVDRFAFVGRPFDLHLLVNNAVINLICIITYGERFEYGDETFKKLLTLFENSLNEEVGLLPELLHVAPILLRIPGLPQKIFRCQKEYIDFTEMLIDKHKETWNPAYTRDFTDAFLKEMTKGKEAEENGFNKSNLTMVTSDLLAAGSQTTSTTLRWAFLFMLLYPEIQSK
ncbi:cytochrome P450 2D3-like [Phasianus colchicus]|uniref:cytochrome P450 2D3-like n=1 Tax=Phasianus colchicus TaxID=9054 RepID=UPI00129D6D49|nr:cytochrome P450 2D3-like [Phasianus colchicus]